MSARGIFGMFPDLLQLPTHAERKQVWRDSYRRMFWRFWYWLMLALIQVGAQLVFGIPARHYAKSFGVPRFLADLGIPIIIAVLAMFLILWIWRRGITQFIRRELNARGLPTCMRCGYPLRDLPADVRHCPECGAQRQ